MARVAETHLWGRRIGAVSWDWDRHYAAFEYDPDFVPSGIELAPIAMPLARRIYRFPGLAEETFRGLPGLVADSLPDRFGNRVIDAHLAACGRSVADFSPVDRLLYIGNRGMGALEFLPPTLPAGKSLPIDVGALAQLAGMILTDRRTFSASLDPASPERAEMEKILQVGASAGGARAKALVAWNPDTGELRSGQVAAPPGFQHWLLKFDGVSGNREPEQIADPMGYGLIEYAYSKMARAAGIEMTACRVLEEGPRHHFMTHRFDRTGDGAKLHMQTLCALGHLDYNQPGAHGYEQAFAICRRISARGMDDTEQLFRRMAFNVMARNCDDHSKNFAFLMDKRGRWSLAPAYDLTYAYNPTGLWTRAHQMTINGKREQFDRDDLLAVTRQAPMKRGLATAILDDVRQAVALWPRFAEEARVPEDQSSAIQANHILIGLR